MRRVRGLTLVELLLSIALAVFLVAAMLQVYRVGKSVLRWQVEAARLEENGRHALGLLVRELRMAGFFGREALAALPSPRSDAPDCGGVPGWVLDPSAPLAVIDDFAGGEARLISGARLMCLPETRLVRGSDALVIKRTAALPSRAVGPGSGLRQRSRSRWYLLTDGSEPAMTLFLDAAGDTSVTVPAAATWWEWRSHIFYLRNYSQSPGDGIPVLCNERLGSAMRSVCLVEGVERLQLEFGIDSNGDGVADSLMRAPTPADLANAITARVYLLARSLRELHRRPQAQAFRLGATEVTLPPDRYLRRVFSATVPLHNIRAQAGTHDAA